MAELDINNLSHEELSDYLVRILVRLRQIESEEIKADYLTKSQRMLLAETIQKHLDQNPSEQAQNNQGRS